MAMGMERKVEQEVCEEIKIEPTVNAPLGDHDVEVAGRAVHGEQHGVLIALQPQPMTIHTGEYPEQRQYDGAISSRATSMTGTWFDIETKMTVAHVVPFKGALIDWLGEQLVRDLVRFGISRHGHLEIGTERDSSDAERRQDDHRAQPRGGLPGQRICGARHPDRGEDLEDSPAGVGRQGEGEDQRGTSHLRMAGGVQRRPVQQVFSPPWSSRSTLCSGSLEKFKVA